MCQNERERERVEANVTCSDLHFLPLPRCRHGVEGVHVEQAEKTHTHTHVNTKKLAPWKGSCFGALLLHFCFFIKLLAALKQKKRTENKNSRIDGCK